MLLFASFIALSPIFCRIIEALSLEERGLFRERIRHLDKKIHPGLTKLTWASKGISDFFIGECRLHAGKVSKPEVVCDTHIRNLIYNLTLLLSLKRDRVGGNGCGVYPNFFFFKPESAPSYKLEIPLFF